MIGALIEDFWPYLIAGLVAIAGALGIYTKGRSDAKTKADAEALTEYKDRRKEIDNADVSSGVADDDREWLRDRAER